MTRDEFTAGLPPVTNALRSKPPFQFNGLSARFFPLRASLDALQQLCNCYVNIVPPEVGRFRAALPYAFLAMLDYSSIADLESRTGWFAQAEVYFGVPVEWYKVVRGRWVFHDWAVLTPYIFVDDDFSVPLGRSVFGFPKTLARMTTPSQWLTDPRAPATVAGVKTAVFPDLYQGRKMKYRVFLELTRDGSASHFGVPPDPQNPMAPWVIASHLAHAAAGFGRDAMWFAQSMRVSPDYPGADPTSFSAMIDRLAPGFAPGGPGFILNSINLKQLPRSDQPRLASYQALTNGPMHATAINGFGLLGEERAILGDVSGGYTVRLHQYSSLPIARILGLEVDRQWRGDGVDVASLKPVMPFWLNVNVRYEQGINLAWRHAEIQRSGRSSTTVGIWRGGDGAPLESGTTEVDPAINTAPGNSVDNITGPFHFTGTTVRVLPLLAFGTTLQAFIDQRVNDAISQPPASFVREVDGRRRSSKERVKLSVWTRGASPADPAASGTATAAGPYAYVYLAVASLGEVTSGSNNVGDWAKYELSFLIPVKWEREGPNQTWILEGVGLFPAYNFVDNAPAAVSRTEVLGVPTARATFVSPESVWLKEGATVLGEKQTLLRMDTEVFPALGVGQQAARLPVVEISERDIERGVGDADSPSAADRWAAILKLELESKKDTKRRAKEECHIARALALELLGNQTPVSLFALKQLRDAADPGQACYQSLVRVSLKLEEVVDIREIEQTLTVRLRDFPTFEPVQSLGLVANRLREDGSGIIYGTQAIRPFYVRVTVAESGEALMSRSGTLQWELGDEAFRSLLREPAGDQEPEIVVDREAARMQDQASPDRMNAVARRAVARRGRERELHEELTRIHGQQGANTRKLGNLKKGRIPGAAAEAKRLNLEQGRLARLAVAVGKQQRAIDPGISPRDALACLATIDPQMVIESILSREWGNTAEDTRWREGRRELLKIRETTLAGGSIPFSAAEYWPQAPGGTGPGQHPLKDRLKKGRIEFAGLEKALYERVITDKVNRPGRTPLNRREIRDMIASVREFTLGRLEVEFYFNIVAAFTLQPGSTASAEADRFGQAYAAVTLINAMDLLCRTRVLGEPAEEHSDPRVTAGKTRLVEIVGVLRKSLGTMFVKRTKFDADPPVRPRTGQHSRWALATVAEYVKPRMEQRSPDQLIDELQQSIALIREAVTLAIQYSNVQRDALLDKLSRSYQKPDFCLRRDAVGRERSHLLPRVESWDEDWYYGPSNPQDLEEDRRDAAARRRRAGGSPPAARR